MACRTLPNTWASTSRSASTATHARQLELLEGRELGKIQHLDVEDLRVKQKIRDRDVDLVKILGTDNPADVLTQYVAADLLNKMLGNIGMVHMDGRASTTPELPKEQCQATTLICKTRVLLQVANAFVQ